MKNTRTLAQIAKAIKTLEKKSIQNVIEIGKLLNEASKQCVHGEYMDWLKQEFSYSHDTSLNYRHAYDLSQNPNCSDFRTWNMSIRAFYVVARLLKDSDANAKGAAKAIIKVAKKRRVSARDALLIYQDYDDKHSEPLSPLEPPQPSSSSDDESSDTEPDDSDTPEQRWQHGLSEMAGYAIALQAQWTREFGEDWEKFEVPSDLVTLAKQATNAWAEVAAKLTNSTKSSAIMVMAERAEARAKAKAAT